MAEDARQIFLDIVFGNDPTYFKSSDMALLCRYAEANALAARAAAALLKVGPIAGDKASPWLAVHAVATKEVTALAMRLRLSPQSRQPNNPRSARTPPASYYERLQMERGS
jgi:hypothetical protein